MERAVMVHYSSRKLILTDAPEHPAKHPETFHFA